MAKGKSKTKTSKTLPKVETETVEAPDNQDVETNEEETEEEEPKVETETVVKYYALYQFSGNRRGGDILKGQEVFAKDFGGEEALEDRVDKKHIEERTVEVEVAK
jgi:hypothetical protein